MLTYIRKYIVIKERKRVNVMFKMIKYEYRKNIVSVIILLIVLAAIQVYTLGAALLDNENHAAIGISIFMLASFACYIFVLLYGIISYSKDLKNKDGYLVFMTPLSSYQIIGAKLLCTLITGVLLVFIIAGLAVLDYAVLANQFGFDSLVEVFDALFDSMGYNLKEILINILAFVVTFLIQFFMTVTMAYMAVSLSCTLLQNNKAKGFVSFIFFVIFYIIVSVISVKLPLLETPVHATDSLAWNLYKALPQIILYVVCMIGCYLGSSLLLDKKISL